MRNLLEIWYNNLQNTTSELNYKKVGFPSRKQADFIKQFLGDFFSSDFFLVEDKFNRKAPEVMNSNWLHSLLSNHHLPANIAQLLEFCTVLNYYQDRDPYLLNPLISQIKSNRDFRNLYFELYIFYTLDINGIPNLKKNKEGNKELEGIIQMLDKDILFECKKIYSPKSEVLETLMIFLGHGQKQMKKQQTSVIGSLEIIASSNKIKGQLNRLISNGINHVKTTNKELLYSSPKGDFVLNVYPFESKKLEPLNDELKGKDHGIFYYNQPETSIPDLILFPNKGALASVTHPFNDSIKHLLENKIRKKRKDRRDSSYKYRVYFVELDFLQSLDHGMLLLNTKPGQLADIQNYVNQKTSNDIVILIRRGIPNSKNLLVKVDIFCKPELDHFKNQFLRLQFNHV